jgi:hypothetical protein
VSHRYQPGTYNFWSCQSALGVDPLYQEMCYKGKITSARVSPKPKRIGDWVARKRFRIGQGKALPELISQVIYHDELIAQFI